MTGTDFHGNAVTTSSPEAIAALDGVDCLWIGHFDLSASLGIPGRFDSPVFTDAVDAVMAAAKRNGVSVGRLVASGEEGADKSKASESESTRIGHRRIA